MRQYKGSVALCATTRVMKTRTPIPFPNILTSPVGVRGRQKDGNRNVDMCKTEPSPPPCTKQAPGQPRSSNSLGQPNTLSFSDANLNTEGNPRCGGRRQAKPAKQQLHAPENALAFWLHLVRPRCLDWSAAGASRAPISHIARRPKRKRRCNPIRICAETKGKEREREREREREAAAGFGKGERM